MLSTPFIHISQKKQFVLMLNNSYFVCEQKESIRVIIHDILHCLMNNDFGFVNLWKTCQSIQSTLGSRNFFILKFLTTLQTVESSDFILSVSTTKGCYLLSYQHEWKNLGEFLQGESVNSLSMTTNKSLIASTLTEGIFICKSRHGFAIGVAGDNKV